MSRYIKYGSLIFLIVQNAGLMLTMRYSRTLSGDMYYSSTAVVFTEIFKLLSCLFLTLYQIQDITQWLKFLFDNILASPLTTLKVAVPSFIYVIQNNLQFVAISNLDAATFQVIYQLKILTTAIFSVLLIRKEINKMKWVSLVMLFVGVVLVKIQSQYVAPVGQKPFVGFVAVLLSTVCSGFAGVYFEIILKKDTNQDSVWLRNIQLSLLGVIISYIGMLFNDGINIIENGMLYGYSPIVWFVIFLQAIGGLLTAVVIKYADNILKGFATSFSIIISCIVSIYVFNFILSIQFVVGTFLVCSSVYIYGCN